VIICVRTKSLIFDIRIGKQKYFGTFYYLDLTECVPVLYDHTCYVKGVLEKCYDMKDRLMTVFKILFLQCEYCSQ
jgi:hypothetical protein